MYRQTYTMKTKTKDTQLVVRISNEDKTRYNKYCESKGYTVSKRILVLLEKDMNNEI